MPRRRRAPVSFVLAALLGAAPAAAQNNAAATIAVPPPPAQSEDTVGPEQLRDFSLPGTVTRRSETPAETPGARSSPSQQADPMPQRPAPTAARPTVTAPVAAPVEQRAGPRPQTLPTPAPSLDLPPPTPATPLESRGQAPIEPMPSRPAEPATPADGSNLPLWPWLVAGALAAVAGALWLRRRRSLVEDEGRLAFAGAVAAPTPSPAPAPPPARETTPAPPPVQPAAEQPPIASAPVGIVSSRLRPWIDLEFAPLRAVLSETEIVIDFELAVFNSGSVPARQAVVEAVILNAGEEQERELAAFYSRQEIPGEGIEAVPPLGRMPFQSQVRLPRANVREYAVEGRRLFIPLVAFNAAYRWSGGQGRTSAAFLVGLGRPGADKLGPLRVDQGSREWRDLAAKLLPSGERR